MKLEQTKASSGLPLTTPISSLRFVPSFKVKVKKPINNIAYHRQLHRLRKAYQ